MLTSRTVVAAAVALLASVAIARAELLVYEPFNYTAGIDMDGLPANGTNLTGDYETDTLFDLVIGSPSLDYGSLTASALPSVAGNNLSQANGTVAGATTVQLAQNVSIPAGQVVYFSALFNFDDGPNANRLANITLLDNATGDLLRFGQPAVGVRNIRIEADTAAIGELEADGADNSFVDGRTYWLIGRYINSPDADGDMAQLMGYDTTTTATIPDTFDPADPDAVFSYSLDGLDIDLTQITTLRFTIRGDNNNFLDELRIGRTYTDVAGVPEPTAALCALTPLLLLRRRGHNLRRPAST